MQIHVSLFVLLWTAQTVFSAITADNIKTSVDSFTLQFPFNPIKDLYWTGMKTHRRVCFAASPSGDVGYVAYLDASGKGVHVQQVNLQTFEAVGDAFTVPEGREAGGLVVHEEGVALLTNEPLPKGTKDAPPPDGEGKPTPVPVLYRIIDGQVKWKVFLAGPGLHPKEGLGAAVDMNGDLVWSPAKKLYAAYFVISYYSGDGKGHFSDSIQYVDENGQIQDIEGATSAGGCSHNTGIAFEEADDAPFTSACAEDQTGTVWINTKNQGEDSPAVPLSVEPFINGMSGEPFNGMGGSWSVLVRLGKSQSYAITWLTRNTELKDSPKEPDTNTNTKGGTVPQETNPDQKEDTTEPPEKLGTRLFRLFRRHASKKKTPKKNPTNSKQVATPQQQPPDTTNSKNGGSGNGEGGNGASPRQIAIAILPDKFSVGPKNIITSPPADHFNTHIAAFDEKTILSTYEEIENPDCVKAAGCLGTWAGTYFAQVDATTGKVDGEAFKSTEIFVGGDLVTLSNGICFPYVSMKWDTSTKVDGSSGTGDQGVMMGNGPQEQDAQKLSFACVSNPSGTTSTTEGGGSGGGAGSTTTTTTTNNNNNINKHHLHKRRMRRFLGHDSSPLMPWW